MEEGGRQSSQHNAAAGDVAGHAPQFQFQAARPAVEESAGAGVTLDEVEELRMMEHQREEMIAELIGTQLWCDEKYSSMEEEWRQERERKNAELVHDIYSLEKKLDEHKAVTMDFPEVVHLNVGGTNFTTTVSTLRREPGSMLDSMFSGRHLLAVDKDDRYFIDRDGEVFGSILCYLRTGQLPEDLSTMALRRLKVEADYYGLDGLLGLLEGGARSSRPQFAILSYTSGFTPSAFIGPIPEGVELVFFQDDCYRSCKDMTEVLGNMKEKGWTLVLNVPPTSVPTSKGRLIFRKEELQGGQSAGGGSGFHKDAALDY